MSNRERGYGRHRDRSDVHAVAGIVVNIGIEDIEPLRALDVERIAGAWARTRARRHGVASPCAPSRAWCVDGTGLRPLPDCRRDVLPLSERSRTSNLTRQARPSGATARPEIAREEASGSTGSVGGSALTAKESGPWSPGRPRQRPVRADQRARRRTVTATGSRA